MPGTEAGRNACRVLLVEDDPHYGGSFKQAVAEARDSLNLEIELEHVEDGLAAVYLVSQYYLTETLPHAVIDLDMLHRDGTDLIGAVRRHPILKDLPLLVLTSSTSPSFHEEAARAGADRVFAKPADSGALLRVATEMIEAQCPLQPDRGDKG